MLQTEDLHPLPLGQRVPAALGSLRQPQVEAAEGLLLRGIRHPGAPGGSGPGLREAVVLVGDAPVFHGVSFLLPSFPHRDGGVKQKASYSNSVRIRSLVS